MKFSQNNILLLLITLYASLAWLDMILSIIGFAMGGTELNPFLLPFAHTPELFIIVKMTGVTLIVILALFCRFITRKGDYIVMSTACTLGIVPVIWNIRVLGLW